MVTLARTKVGSTRLVMTAHNDFLGLHISFEKCLYLTLQYFGDLFFRNDNRNVVLRMIFPNAHFNSVLSALICHEYDKYKIT